MWAIRVYRSASGRSHVKDWYDGLPESTRGTVWAKIRFLKQQPRHYWKRPQFDELHGDGNGLGEIRFKLDNVQNILIGYFGPERMEFTIVAHAIEKGTRYRPPNAIKTAQARKRENINAESTTELWFP
jgi:hypothetical protein